MPDKFRVHYENGDHPDGRLVYPPEDEDTDAPLIVTNQHGDLLVIEPEELLQDDYSISRLRWDAIGVRKDDYTGSDDKDGKPIYERDLVQVEHEWGPDTYRVVWNSNLANWRGKCLRRSQNQLFNEVSLRMLRGGTVVGNVHQDDELDYRACT